MPSKINLIEIWRDHIATLVDSKHNMPSREDKLLFFVLPALLSFLIIIFNIDISKIYSVFIASLSIFTGFLLNLLIVMISVRDIFERYCPDSDNENRRKNVRLEVSRETIANISYSIAIGIVNIVTLVVALLSHGAFKHVMNFLSIYIFINLVLTLLMIIKRTYMLSK